MQGRENREEIEGMQGPPGSEYPFNLEPWVIGSDIKLKGIDCICPQCFKKQRFYKVTKVLSSELEVATFLVKTLNVCESCAQVLNFSDITPDEKERLQLKMENSIQEGII